MTTQEAIKLIHCCMHIGDERIIEARNMAISALEKQIQKKPIIKTCKYIDEDDFLNRYQCPTCNLILFYENKNRFFGGKNENIVIADRLWIGVTYYDYYRFPF